jgi:hypothetical protein
VTKRILPLLPGGLVVEQVLPEPDRVTVVARFRLPTSTCPGCRAPSSRVHSRYERRLADPPWQGRPVTVRVRARRFFCAEPACPRRTFAERLPGIARPSARRCERLADVQRQVALALGGEAGARLSARLAAPTSADTLLRLASSATRAAPPAPRALGVDEWAWRKRRRYGTILVDLERSKVVDLLPDRDAGSFGAWLRDHPGEAASLLAENPSYVFFRELLGEGPVGAGKVVLTPGRSLAVDRGFVPLGAPLWLDLADAPDGRGRRLVIAQDTGGAIRGPVRGDLFWGHGEAAASYAGMMRTEGEYYLLLPRSLVGRLASGTTRFSLY